MTSPSPEEPTPEIRVRLRDPHSRGRLLSVMRRPTSLLLLLLAIVMAVGFSLLGQWQLERAFERGAVIETESEHPLPLDTVTHPQVQTPSDAVGQLITVDGQWVRQDLLILRDRLNDGASGYWVVGHLVTGAGDSLAVALGWAGEEAEARAALDAYASGDAVLPGRIDGRYQQSEQPTLDEAAWPGGLAKEMAVPAFVNEWQDAGPVYSGYATLLEAPDGLASIHSPAPERQVQLNVLNLFYTIEWIVFAVIALYIWYRHMRDVAEREAEREAQSATSGP